MKNSIRKARFWLARKILPVIGDVPPVKMKGLTLQQILDATGGETKLPTPAVYRTFSGIDIKVYFEDSENNFMCVPEIQAISVDDSLQGRVRGTILTLLFDGDVLSYLPMKPKNMLLVAANEYGVVAYSRIENIKFVHKTWGATIDDLILEVNTEFEATACTHWKKIGDWHYDKIPEMPEQILERLRSYK